MVQARSLSGWNTRRLQTTVIGLNLTHLFLPLPHHHRPPSPPTKPLSQRHKTFLRHAAPARSQARVVHHWSNTGPTIGERYTCRHLCGPTSRFNGCEIILSKYDQAVYWYGDLVQQDASMRREFFNYPVTIRLACQMFKEPEIMGPENTKSFNEKKEVLPPGDKDRLTLQ